MRNLKRIFMFSQLGRKTSPQYLPGKGEKTETKEEKDDLRSFFINEKIICRKSPTPFLRRKNISVRQVAAKQITERKMYIKMEKNTTEHICPDNWKA
ncbi:hypothetical protein POVWA2_037820 [Plasmodium ovale wallikeri]|uniref:Uncharacterized protein n=1 Tax=Plasmodium ovale wallikeri TaxID=864142 RepID=A0A1A8Z4V6_PLAOA|nr:hypothetical protein POVWA1_038850 [Plasmodium ovale wallikeri]SBT39401.1 hypothetical protein POVWA2_037820 [Plasmodium ovale wallikeri]